MGIGAPKAGTTQIANLLAAHPQICLSEPKEVHYFNAEMAYIHPRGNKNNQQSIEWYKKHFKHCAIDSIKGEFSTGYLSDKQAPANISKTFPKVKLIVCMRHPAERAYSQYIMFRDYFQKENRAFEVVLEEQEEFVEKGLYFQNIQRFLTHFSSEQLFFVVLEDLKNDPEKLLGELYDFLKVDPSFIPDLINKKANSAKKSKYPFISEWMGYFSKALVAVGASKYLDKMKRAGWKDWLISMNSQEIAYEPMSVTARAFILERTIADTERLERFLNRDLSHWKK